MAVDKFKFVSPGVFIDEIDNSELPRLLSPAELVMMFGEMVIIPLQLTLHMLRKLG